MGRVGNTNTGDAMQLGIRWKLVLLYCKVIYILNENDRHLWMENEAYVFIGKHKKI
jgi:hypothetical protein